MARKKTLKFETIESTDWDHILSEVEKKEIPIDLIDSVIINLISGHSIEISISKLIEDGTNPLDIEKKLNEKLTSLSDIIQDVDFHIKKDKVIKAIAPYTKKILKKIP